MYPYKLALGPMSPSIIRCIYRYSDRNKVPLMLISSMNQIDVPYGYVNGWSTKEYSLFLSDQLKIYPNAQILVCRDHCGPGFFNPSGRKSLPSCIDTIDTDISSGFKLIHVDTCHTDNPLENAKRLIKHIQSSEKTYPIRLEIGTDENIGLAEFDETELRKKIEFFLAFCRPTFYVVNTGSLVKENIQYGAFDLDNSKKVSNIIHEYGLSFKEHNADYLSVEEIKLRKGVVDAMNVAPELGYLETLTALELGEKYYLNIDRFIAHCYQSNVYEKWLIDPNKHISPRNATLIGGHYCFTHPEYKELRSKLNNEEFMNTLYDRISTTINKYIENL